MTPDQTDTLANEAPVTIPAPVGDGGEFSGTCSVCGNHYDKAFTIVHRAGTSVFDCFECAIHALAPTCTRCGCRVVGHGMESEGAIFCCSHCAGAHGVTGLRDRV